ncbi:MAG: oligosaccharide flippase family protein, partial [Chloroflexi bacterium]|nr:oligosaccharide flippase family protein [Chloroflexota bacterium]
MKQLRRLTPYKKDILFLLAFLILPFLIFGDVTLGGKTMLPLDNLFQWAPWSSVATNFGIGIPQNGLISDLIIENYVWKQFARDTFLASDIPLWNPYLFAGAPFLAAGQHSAYYPFSILFFVLPLTKAYGWYTISQLWLAGALMYAFGRILKMRRGSAFLAGLIYQGGGYIVVSAAVFPMIVGAVAWLPLLLGCIEKVIQGKGNNSQQSTINSQQSTVSSHVSNAEQSTEYGLRTTLLWVVLGAVSLGMQILAGHIEFTIYTLLVMALYAAWRLVTRPFTGEESRTQIFKINADLGFYPRLSAFIRVLLSGQTWRSVLLRPFLSLSGMVLLGLMLGAIQLVPLYELGQTNFRQEAASFEDVLTWGFPKRRLLTLALPNFYGNPAHHTYRDAFSADLIPLETNYLGQPKTNSEWGLKNYVEGGIYLGILPLFLTLLGGVAGWKAGKQRRWQTIFFILLALASLAFIFGTPLYAILYYGLPFVNQLHTPFRWVFPLSLCIATLAGFGADRIFNCQLSIVNRQLSILKWLAFLSGGAVLVGLVVSWLFYARVEPIIERLFLGLANATTAFPSTAAFYSYQFWQILTLGLILLGVGIVFWLRGRQFKRPYWLIAAAALIIVDIFVANQGFHTAVSPRLLDYKPELVTWLEAQPGEWRLTSFNPHGDKPFNANSGWLYNLQDIRGYDSIIPKQYTDYMAAIEPQNGLEFNRIQPISNLQSLNSPLLDVLNVKYIITAETINLPKLQLAWEGEGLRVYENLAVAPRAYTLPQTATAVSPTPLTALQTLDPRQYVVIEGESGVRGQGAVLSPAEIKAYSNREVRVDTAVTEPAWLILNDSYFDGWNAFVRPIGSGEDAETRVDIVRVNGNFRGVQLAPGEWTVRFRYSPPSFWLGGLTSLMGGLIILFALIVWGWQRIYKPDAEMSITRSIAKNSLVPMALNLFNKLIDFSLAIYYLRVLGPVNAGSYQTAITTAIIFEIISNFGLDILLIRDVSQDRKQSSHYLLNTTLLRLGAAVVASLPVAVLVFGGVLFNRSALTTPEMIAIGFIMIGMIFSGMSKGVTGLFYVHEQAEVPAAMTTVTTILRVGFSVIVLLLGFGFVGLAGVSILVNIITLTILATIALRRFEITGPWQVDWQLQQQMIRKGFPLMLIHLLQTVFISADVLLLRLQLGEDVGREIAGWYSTAYKWFNALQIVPSFFTLALFPIISREIQNSIESAQRMYRMSIKLMLLLALPISAVTFYLATPLVRLLAGNAYLPHGALALQIVILSIPFGWINSVTNYVLIGLGLERIQPRAFTIAVSFNIIANLIFIPRFDYKAAAVTTILSEIVLLVLFDY